MKKNFFIAAVAALALASCSNDEVVQSAQTSPDNAISFRPLMENVTRAADQTVSTLQVANKGFFVTAMHKPTTEAAAVTYFDNVQFTWDSSSSTYNSATKYYWPAAGTLDFFAYAPEIPTSAPQVVRTDYLNYVVTPSSTVAEQVDLIYANTDGKTKKGEYTPQSGSLNGTASTYGAAGVPLNFRHTGCKIVVKVKNSGTTNLKFDITGWKIANVDGSATFTYDKTSADNNTDGKNAKQLVVGDWSNNTTYDASYTVEWTTANVINTKVDDAAFLNSDGAALSSTTVENINMILIPQTTPDIADPAVYSGSSENQPYPGSYIALKMVISNIAGTTESPIYTPIASADGTVGTGVSQHTKWAMWPVKFTWAPGKKYTYVIDVADGGYWEVNDDTDADLDPILENAIIKFVDVTVDDWSDYDSDSSTDGAQPIDVEGPSL